MMSSVRVSDQFKFLENQYLEISRLIKENTSFEIISSSQFNTNYFVETFFEKYSVRSKFLGKKISNYYFINFSDFNYDINQSDNILLQKLSELVGIEFINLQSVLNFLEEQDRFIILYSNSEPSSFARFLLSYSFILKNHMIYIFSSSQKTELTEKKIELFFSDAFLTFIIEQKLLEMNLINIDSSKILGLINRDLESLYSVILSENSKFKIQDSKEEGKILSSKLQVPNVEDKNRIQSQSEQFVEEVKVVSQKGDEENSKFKIQNSKEEEEEEEGEGKILSSKLQVPNQNMNMQSEFPNLTFRENQVVKILKEKNFISRLEFAEIIWGKEKAGEISNDAIDQVISRLRRKFIKSGFDREYIYSKKGSGIGLSNSII